MNSMIGITLKGIFRDRVLQGILVSAAAFLFIPSLAALSMRQVTELALTLSLSLISFILLMLAVFLGGTSLWKDIERRYVFSVLGLPLSRQRYVCGRFAGIALFIVLISMILGVLACGVVAYSATLYPPERPVDWGVIALCILLDSLKYVMLVAVAFLFSTVSTSFFLPVFGTIATFLAGGAIQQVYEYVRSAAGQTLSPLVVAVAKALYFVIPNFSAFDLKVNAIYSLPVNQQGIVMTLAYFLVYTGALLSIATVVFARREMR